MTGYKKHLFICTNGNDNPQKCAYKKSEELHKALKARCKDQTWSKEVRINKSGCLDKCEHGIAAVMYPEAKWLLNLNSDDVDTLFKEVEKGM